MRPQGVRHTTPVPQTWPSNRRRPIPWCSPGDPPLPPLLPTLTAHLALPVPAGCHEASCPHPCPCGPSPPPWPIPDLWPVPVPMAHPHPHGPSLTLWPVPVPVAHPCPCGPPPPLWPVPVATSPCASSPSCLALNPLETNFLDAHGRDCLSEISDNFCSRGRISTGPRLPEIRTMFPASPAAH